MKKTLIIIRHAHRDKGIDSDNGLSAKGAKQAKLAAKFFKKRYGKTRALLLSSPKKRCAETLIPLSLHLGAKIQIEAVLDEAQRVENLRTQIAEFMKAWEKSNAPITVICSHGDWIPEYLKTITGRSIDLDKGGWAEIEWMDDDEPRLTWLVQKLDFL